MRRCLNTLLDSTAAATASIRVKDARNAYVDAELRAICTRTNEEDRGNGTLGAMAACKLADLTRVQSGSLLGLAHICNGLYFFQTNRLTPRKDPAGSSDPQRPPSRN